MPKQKSAQAQLIAMSAKQSGKSTALPPAPDFIRNMLHFPDPEIAAQIIREQAGLEFDQTEDGIQLERCLLDQVDISAHYDASGLKLKQLKDKLYNTKQFVKSSVLPSDSQVKSKGFWRWRALDQLSITLLSVALIAAMGMGAANVYANLMASGEAVFIQQPGLAICLSLLVPTGSTALKFITVFFEYDRTRKRYALGIYTLTLITMMAWSIAFALNFTGVAGGMDWESLGESNNSGAILVWLQLSAEILIASALFLAAEDIYCKYNPDQTCESLDYLTADKALKNFHKEYEAVAEIRGKNHGQCVCLKAKREAFINTQLVEYHALRSRLNPFT